MNDDKEIAAMHIISSALDGLDDNARSRVLRWAFDRHGVAAPGVGAYREGVVGVVPHNGDNALDLPTLFHNASPHTDAEKALIAGYWFQEVRGEREWEAQPVNAELRNLGHRLSNITDALNSLIERRPSCVMQVGKSGLARQARKRYRLTSAGISFVRELLARADQPDNSVDAKY